MQTSAAAWDEWGGGKGGGEGGETERENQVVEWSSVEFRLGQTCSHKRGRSNFRKSETQSFSLLKTEIEEKGKPYFSE